MSNLQRETFSGKLSGYYEVKGKIIKKAEHFYYSQNKYKEEGRKLTYGVCVDNSDGVITCNKYVPKGEHAEFEDWELEIDNAYKKYRFYKKIPKDDN
jgi:hypothetical protein